MSHKCFEVRSDGPVAHIVLNRPEKRNAMIPEFWDELPEIVGRLDADGGTRAIVVSSTGPHFSAGLDVSVFAAAASAGSDDPERAALRRRQAGARFYDDVRRMQRTFTCLERCRVPVLAAIQGGCIGGGVDLATACDMRYASEDAFFTIFETNIGMTADVGTFPRIVRLVPEGIARELAYTGRRMSAAEAREVGLVNRVFPDHSSLVEGVLEIAREIATKAPLAVYGCKRMITYARDHSTEDALDYIGIWNASMLSPEEIMEAMAANAGKRPGRFAELPPIRASMTARADD
jgi:enoyl-CoA hydratase